MPVRRLVVREVRQHHTSCHSLSLGSVIRTLTQAPHPRRLKLRWWVISGDHP